MIWLSSVCWIGVYQVNQEPWVAGDLETINCLALHLTVVDGTLGIVFYKGRSDEREHRCRWNRPTSTDLTGLVDLTDLTCPMLPSLRELKKYEDIV